MASNACPECGEPRGARYAGRCWLCWVKRQPAPRRARRAAPDALVALAERLSRAIERVTGRAPVYMGRYWLASYCPACLHGTVSIRLLRHPAPGAAFVCSRGCAEPAIAAALRPVS